MTEYKPPETLMDRTEALQKKYRWPEFLASFAQTIVHTAGTWNFITGAICPNHTRIGTSTAREDFIAESIDNTTLHREPTRTTSLNTITYHHCSIPPLTPDISQYQSSASNVSHSHCEYDLCRSCGKAASYHYTCHYHDHEDWEQFLGDSEDGEFEEAPPPTEPQGSASAPLTLIYPAIFEKYTPLTVA